MSFSRGEAQLESKLTSVTEMKNRDIMTMWIELEASKGGTGGAGGKGISLSSIFGFRS